MAERRDGTVSTKKKLGQVACPHVNKKDCAMEGLQKQVLTPVKIRKLKKMETDKPYLLPLKMSEILTGLQSSSPTQTVKICEFLRRVLCREKAVPAGVLNHQGLLNRLTYFLSLDLFSLQYETAWALTNMAAASSALARLVVDSGAARNLVRLLASQNLCLVEQCVWALGNIAGYGAELRDLLLDNSILRPLLNLVDMTAPPNFLCTVAWAISNLCRNKVPSPKMATIQACLPALRLLVQHKDDGVISHACWALSGITDGTHNYIEEVVRYPDLLKRLVELLDSPKIGILTPALQTVANIVSRDESCIQIMIDYDVLDMLPVLLQHRRRNIQKDACWVVSNILGGTSEQRQAVIEDDLLPLLVQVLEKGDPKSQIEAIRAIKHLALLGIPQHSKEIAQYYVFKPLCNLLHRNHARLLLVLLDAVHDVIGAAEEIGLKRSMWYIMEETKAGDRIEQLQDHSNKRIYKKSHRIIESFFTCDSEEEHEPEISDSDKGQSEEEPEPEISDSDKGQCSTDEY